MFDWDPGDYLRFGNERGRPFFDLVARICADAPERVLDLGCGDGGFTASLPNRWPGAQIVGVDSSAQMIEKARTHERPGLTFEQADVRAVTPTADYQVVLSNAVFQWVPEHIEVIRGWAETLEPTSWIAFQVPGNFGSPSHVLMRELASSDRWASLLPQDPLRHDDAVRTPHFYADVLLDAGWTVDAWETTYAHLLQGEDPVLDWVTGTGLRPILGALKPEDAKRFSAEFGVLLREAYPRGPHGTYFDFRRVFCVAHR
jgi:trans-aconitate 2-methyltransferase